jgi:alpha-L-rhamnosidase
MPDLTPYGLRVDLLDAPLGLGNPRPEFSWRLTGPAGSVQRGYELELGEVRTDAGVLWHVQAEDSRDQFGIRYEGPALRSTTAYRWRVRVTDGNGDVGSWSPWAQFETGLFEHDEWTAHWIGNPRDTAGRPSYLTTRIEVPVGVVRARAYASALGWYRLFVDGQDLTGSSLVPGFTSFDHEVEYQTYDITDAVTTGPVRVDLVIGDGRFRGALGIWNRREIYGDKLGGIVQILFELEDGEHVWAGTDQTWRTGHGPIVGSDPKLGETIDLRVPSPLDGGIPDGELPLATLLAPHRRRLVAESTPRLTAVDTLAATVTRHADGSHLVDFGQNFAGVVRIKVAGPAGHRVTLQHSEDIRDDGSLEWEHLAPSGPKAKTGQRRFQRDEIVLDGAEHWVQPWFTLHGFRYVQVAGLDTLTDDDVLGIVLSSDRAPTGRFDSSDARLNQLWRNAYWSLRSNFLDTPTDCPTRERSGFTGDAMVFGSAATVFSDVQTFLRRYLDTLALDQFDDGRVSTIVPGEFSEFSGGPARRSRSFAKSVGWGDASVLLPWTLYERYGDLGVLKAQYESMKRWIGYLDRGGARRGFIWGEWIRAGESNLLGIIRDNSINRKNIGLAYFAHSARTLSRAAEVLNQPDDARHYTQMADRAVRMWRKAALKPQARVGVDRQDDYVRALAFDLLPEESRQAAVDRLVELIEKADDHLATGFLSTPMLLPTLARFGRSDVAYRLLLQTSDPSWLAMVEAGATTVYEYWSEPGRGGKRKGSSNHYAFGAVIEWFVSGIVGLSPTEPGYRRVRIEPVVGGGLTHASTTVDTPFGTISAGWKQVPETAEIEIEVDLPIGITADLVRNDGTVVELGSGEHRFTQLSYAD